MFYGSQAYGIEAASQTYFSKSARSLNLRQAAMLAGLTQAPSAYDPVVAPEKAVARRDEVLRAMLEEGMITRAQHDWARASRSPGCGRATSTRRSRSRTSSATSATS